MLIRKSRTYILEYNYEPKVLPATTHVLMMKMMSQVRSTYFCAILLSTRVFLNVLNVSTIRESRFGGVSQIRHTKNEIGNPSNLSVFNASVQFAMN